MSSWAILASRLEVDRDLAELHTVAEVTVRLILSYLLTPSATFDFDNPLAAQNFAPRQVGPFLSGSR